MARIRASLARLTPRFSSNRMLAEYLEKLYRPAADAYGARIDRNLALTRELDAWGRKLRRHWPEIHWGNLDVEENGAEHVFRAQVVLGDVPPEAVRVQLYAAPANGQSGECREMIRDRALAGAAGGYVYVGRVAGTRPASHYTPRVIPQHAQARIPAEAAWILWYPS